MLIKSNQTCAPKVPYGSHDHQVLSKVPLTVLPAFASLESFKDPAKHVSIDAPPAFQIPSRPMARRESV